MGHSAYSSHNHSSLKNPPFNIDLVEKAHRDLPVFIREYLLEKRGLSDEVIDEYKIGYLNLWGRNWITLPITDKDGSYLFFKIRKSPLDKDNKLKYAVYPSGSSLFGWQQLNKNNEILFITEGELDALSLISNGIPAVSSTTGAGSNFKKEWIDDLKNVSNLYICYDNDSVGDKNADILAKALSRQLPNSIIYKTALPNMEGDYKDITDYFVAHKGNADYLIEKYSRKIDERKSTPVADDITEKRVATISKECIPMSYEEWKNEIAKHFPELVFPAEIALSVVVQILIKDITNPFGLVLQDVPSSGKTIVLNFFSGIEEITYSSDKFTPSAFVSNAANVKKERLPEIDLLPKIKNKAFIIRDLATIFSKKEDNLIECLGILTRVLDGEGLQTDSAVHGSRKYEGEFLFMILAGSTPIPARVQKIMGSLGARLFFLNMNIREKNEKELADQITTLSHKEKELACQKATRNFIYSLWKKYPNGILWNRKEEPLECKLILAHCAKLLARLRGVVQVWKERNDLDYSYNSPIIEKPDRINQLLYNLCRGHALAEGRDQMNYNDLACAITVALDSCPLHRANLFKALLRNGGKMKTSQVEEALSCSKPTALKEMEILIILGVCESISLEQEKSIALKNDFSWFLSPEFGQIRRS